MSFGIKKFIFLINMMNALFALILWTQYFKKIITNEDQQYFAQLQQIIPTILNHIKQVFNLQTKQQIIASLSIYLLVIYSVKSILEFLSEYTNISYKKIIKCLNNIVESTLLYSLILAFVIFNIYSGKYSNDKTGIQSNNPQIVKEKSQINIQDRIIYQFLLIFFVGRIFFTVGYLIGTWVGIETFRSIGVAFTFVPIIIGICYIENSDVWNLV